MFHGSPGFSGKRVSDTSVTEIDLASLHWEPIPWSFCLDEELVKQLLGPRCEDFKVEQLFMETDDGNEAW